MCIIAIVLLELVRDESKHFSDQVGLLHEISTSLLANFVFVSGSTFATRALQSPVAPFTNMV